MKITAFTLLYKFKKLKRKRLQYVKLRTYVPISLAAMTEPIFPSRNVYMHSIGTYIHV